MTSRALTLAVRVFAWGVAGLVLMASVLPLGVAVVTGTEWGHRQVLAVARPRLEAALDGRLRIGHLGGDLLSGLVLDDVAIDDREGQVAVRARTLAVRYSLRSLLHRSLIVDEVRVADLWVRGRSLGDGRLNLTTLVKPSPPSAPSPHPFTLAVRRVLVSAEVHYDAPPRADPLLRRGGSARLQLDGALRLAGARTEVTIARLATAIDRPARARVELAGAVRLEGATVTVEALAVSLAGRGEELGGLLPSARLRGPFSANLDAHGPLERLAVHAAIVPASGLIEARGTLALHGSDVAWAGRVTARDVDPGAATALVPHGTIALDLDGTGVSGAGTLRLARLEARFLDAYARVQGTADLRGYGHLEVSVTARDLARFATLGVPGLGGSIEAHARVSRAAGHLAIEAQVSGRQLRHDALRLARVTATVHVVDALGDVRVEGHGLRAAGQTLDTVHLTAHADRRAGSAHLDAQGPRKTVIALALRGRPLWRGARLIGADARLDRLVLGRGGERWQSAGAAHLRLDSELTLEHLVLGSGRQRIALAAHTSRRRQALTAVVTTHAVDVARVLRLVTEPGALPSTSVDAELHVSGPLAAPLVEASIAATAAKIGTLERVALNVRARYAAQRLRGEIAVRSVTAGCSGRFDLPVSLAGAAAPLSLDLTTSGVRLKALRPLLPVALAGLDGRVEVRLHAAGSLQTPDLTLTLRAADWQIGGAAVGDRPMKSDTLLEVAHQGGVLKLHTTTRLGGGAGQLDADLALPLDLHRALGHPAEAWRELRATARVQASVVAARVDLAKLPFEYVGLTRPVNAGVIDASVKLAGTLEAPALQVRLAARGVQREAVVDQVDLKLALDLLDRQLQLTGGLELRGQRLLAATGRSTIDIRRLVAGQPWREEPLVLEVTIPGYDLVRLRGMQPQLDTLEGRLEAAIHVTGTLLKQVVSASGEIKGLRLAEARFNRFTLKGDFEGTRVKAEFDAGQLAGGTLHFGGTMPLDQTAPWHLALESKRFDLGFLSGMLSDLRSAKGALEARLGIDGSRAKPTLEAHVEVRDGAFQLRVDPHPYAKIHLDARVHAGALELTTLTVSSGAGTLSATGHAALRGFLPVRGDFELETHRFALVLGSLAAWLDSGIALHVDGDGTKVHARVNIKQGLVRLPKMASTRTLQPIGSPPHVVFVDRQARAEASARAAAASGAAASASVSVHIPGPFYIRSQEADAELKGDLELSVRGPEIRLTGSAETSTGWIELLGQRYVIEHARVGFSGPPENPTLDVRLTRALREATLVIEVHGTGRKPQLELLSDPPIYDKSQILGIILTGDPAGQRVSDRGLDQRVVGAMSGLVLGKLKDTLAPSLPIDVIHVQTGDSGYTGVEQTRVEVGKFITPNLYVSYVHQFGQPPIAGAANENEARVEYRFKRHFELTTSFGDAGVGSLDLYWTRRY